MKNERRLEILGILIIALSFFLLLSIIGYNQNEEPSISSGIQIENPMGILGVSISHLFIKLGFGYNVIILPFLGFAWGWSLFSKKDMTTFIKSLKIFTYPHGFIIFKYWCTNSFLCGRREKLYNLRFNWR